MGAFVLISGSIPLEPSPLFTTAEIRKVEGAALAQVPEGTLMARAGRAAADLALRLMKPAGRARVLVLAGPGNNGGDALVAARVLADHGHEVHLMPLYDPGHNRPPDSARALKQCEDSDTLFVPPVADSVETGPGWDLVIDGIFGIGLRRGVDKPLHDIIQSINRLPGPVLALDVPSGLNADSGNVIDKTGIAVVATTTLTFIADKPGLHTADGRDFAGEVVVADLDIDPCLFPQTALHLSNIDAFRPALRRRLHGSHKGTYGDVIVVGGTAGMAGAPIMTARAAAFCGAGRVIVAMLDRVAAYDPQYPELMLRKADEISLDSGVIIAGPGMGNGDHALLQRVLESPNAVVLDADALNMVASSSALQAALSSRTNGTLITPHPLEAARLLQTSTATIQADRTEAARELARRYACIVLLKGSGSIVAAPDGEAMINPNGNPALATAGSGDILAGVCGALLAQSFSPWHAALAGAWLHGASADALVAAGKGPIGITASELLPGIRALLNQITSQFAPRHGR